ncbi:hypothetical protein ACQKLP_22095 [Chitinophaga sp. NPDC101104]|uniref:gliding motility lipoprotein GldB n=1 Tax=Chitinophaga sp. NPDC101104 TaxID=3390561 RepID=UPI003CFD17BE
MQSYLKIHSLSILILTAAIMAGCGRKKQIPDVSHIPITVKIERFDRAFSGIDTTNVATGVKLLQEMYPGFMNDYLSHILYLPNTGDSAALMRSVHDFLSNKDIRALNDSVGAHFADIRPLEQELTQAFRLAKYYQPKFRAPQVLTFISAVNNFGAVTIDSVLGIGLDMYMGADFNVYKLVPDMPEYMVRRFTPENIPVNVMTVLYQQLDAPREGATLAEQLIYLGKQQYFLEQVLPETDAHIRMGYTSGQMKFCEENEQMIWQYFVENKLLYNREGQTIARYIGDGPSTQGMPAEAPGKIGAFTGYRIVRAFMERHPEYTLEKLMGTQDAMLIFNGAKYRP